MPIDDTYSYPSTCNLKFQTWISLIFDQVALLFPQPFYSCNWGLALPCIAKTSSGRFVGLTPLVPPL